MSLFWAHHGMRSMKKDVLHGLFIGEIINITNADFMMQYLVECY
jgi:hypothetical protein